MKNNQRLKSKLTLVSNKKQHIKLFAFFLVAFLLLGSISPRVSARTPYFYARECRYLYEDDEIVEVPDSAFDYYDMRFDLKMSGQKQCRNKDSNVYIVRAAKDFNVKTKKLNSKYDINTDKITRVETTIKIKKGDLLTMFDDVDMQGTGKVKIVFGRQFFLINIREDLLAKDNTGELLKSVSVDTSLKKNALRIVIQHEGCEEVERVSVQEKPEVNSKIIGAFQKDTALLLLNGVIIDKNAPSEWVGTFLKVNLPGGGIGYLSAFNIASFAK